MLTWATSYRPALQLGARIGLRPADSQRYLADEGDFSGIGNDATESLKCPTNLDVAPARYRSMQTLLGHASGLMPAGAFRVLASHAASSAITNVNFATSQVNADIANEVTMFVS